MKNFFKKILAYFVIIITFFFSGCEKDLYEEPIKNNSKNILPEGFFVKNYIEQELISVPNLKPLLIMAKNRFNAIYQTNQLAQNTINEGIPILDMSLVTSMEVGEYKSFSIKINGVFEQDIFKNLVVEMFTDDDYLISIVTYKHDFVDGPYKFESKEVLEGTFDPFVEEDGVTVRCSYQFFIVNYFILWCNSPNQTPILKEEIEFGWQILCQGGGPSPSSGGIIHGVGLYTGTGSSAYSPNPVYTSSEQVINSLKPFSKTKFNNLYPAAKNNIINYINQNLNYPIRLGNVKSFINSLGDIDNAQTYNFFNQLVDGHYISEHTTIKSEVISHLGLNHYDYLTTQPFIFQITQQIHQNPMVFTSINPFLIEKQIDDSQLNPCSKGVFQQIENTTNCDFAYILAKLNIETTPYNTTIVSQVAPSGAPAQTVKISPYNYKIYISIDYPGKTKLFIATMILHEMVHAYFMSLFDDYYNSPIPNLNAYNEFAYLYDFYVNKKYPGSLPASIHHQQMATDYAMAIARALQEYQTGVPVPDGVTPNQIYSDLAFGSLQDAPTVFDALFPIGNPNRQRIINRYACEQTGNPSGQGTSNQQNPIGQPCN